MVQCLHVFNLNYITMHCYYGATSQYSGHVYLVPDFRVSLQ